MMLFKKVREKSTEKAKIYIFKFYSFMLQQLLSVENKLLKAYKVLCNQNFHVE